MNEIEIYRRAGLLWDRERDECGNAIGAFAMCPKCKCRLEKSKEKYEMGEYKYKCIQCDFKTTLDKSIEDKGINFLYVLESKQYKDADIINLDGDLIRIQREGIKDDDYWIDAKITKNRKGELQVMILVGSKKSSDKVQLFLDPTHEKLTFDQNDTHPKEIFSKVVAIFKDSNSEINNNETIELF